MKSQVCSIIIPVYNEECFLENYFEKLKGAITPQREYEIIFVNDGSTDFSLRLLQKFAKNNSNVKIITLDKNYGKQIAVTAGMKASQGESVVVLSIKDGQPFNSIIKLREAHFAGNEIVKAYKNAKNGFFKRGYEKFKKLCMQTFMILFGVKGRLQLKADAELYDRKVVDILNELPEKNMLLRQTDSFFGFSTAHVYYEAKKSAPEEQFEFNTKKIEFKDMRKAEALPEPKKIKKRYYESSLWLSYGLFILFGALFLALFLLISFQAGSFAIVLTCFLQVCVLVLSILYAIKSILIKRLGVTFYLKPNESLYNISSMENF